MTGIVNESRLGRLQSYLERKVSFQKISPLSFVHTANLRFRPQDAHENSLIHVTLRLLEPDLPISVTLAYALPVTLLDASLSCSRMSLSISYPLVVSRDPARRTYKMSQSLCELQQGLPTEDIAFSLTKSSVYFHSPQGCGFTLLP
jgi:hypothetical protein